jgi:signal peptidase I
VTSGVVAPLVLAASVIGVLILVGLTLARRLAVATVRGISMLPTYSDGDRVVVRRRLPLAVGQVVVVEQPAPDARWHRPALKAAAGARAVSTRRWMIKRVAAIPGDPVPRNRVPALTDEDGSSVPPGKLVLLGDNQQASYDSRDIGYFPAERVLGVATAGAKIRHGC